MFEGQAERPQPASIDTAFSELSVQAFACWIRLMTIPGWELKKGRNYIADKLDVPVRTANRYFTELEEKGYIRMIRSVGLPTQVYLVLAPILLPPNHFISFT